MSGSVLSFLFEDDVVTLDIADKTNLISLTRRWDFVWTLARHIRLFGQEEMTVETQMEQDFLMGLSVELQSEQTFRWSRGWKKCILWSRVKNLVKKGPKRPIQLSAVVRAIHRHL